MNLHAIIPRQQSRRLMLNRKQNEKCRFMAPFVIG